MFPVFPGLLFDLNLLFFCFQWGRDGRLLKEGGFFPSKFQGTGTDLLVFFCLVFFVSVTHCLQVAMK